MLMWIPSPEPGLLHPIVSYLLTSAPDPSRWATERHKSLGLDHPSSQTADCLGALSWCLWNPDSVFFSDQKAGRTKDLEMKGLPSPRDIYTAGRRRPHLRLR